MVFEITCALQNPQHMGHNKINTYTLIISDTVEVNQVGPASILTLNISNSKHAGAPFKSPMPMDVANRKQSVARRVQARRLPALEQPPNEDNFNLRQLRSHTNRLNGDQVPPNTAPPPKNTENLKLSGEFRRRIRKNPLF